MEIPACYIAKDAMLHSYVVHTCLLGLCRCEFTNCCRFCAGRPTSLVIDAGGSGIRVTPVIDGYTLRNGTHRVVRIYSDVMLRSTAVVSTDRGGEWLDEQVGAYLHAHNINVTPRYELPGHAVMDRITDSFKMACVKDIYRDIKHCILKVPDRQLSPSEKNE